jgi:hypothetical protein
MNEDMILDKKKTTGKRSVYKLVDAKSFVDDALKIFGGTQI